MGVLSLRSREGVVLNSHGPRGIAWALEMANWLKGRGYEENQEKQLWNYIPLVITIDGR